jgi:hypothetical protein
MMRSAPRPFPQLVQRLVHVGGERDFRAAVHGDLGRRADLSAEGADDEKTHDNYSVFRPDLT